MANRRQPSPRGIAGLCRMCGERYGGIGSVGLFEDRGDKPTYALLMKQLLGDQVHQRDLKPDRLGITCAKLLDEWAAFRQRCIDAQKQLKKQYESDLKAQSEKKAPEADGSQSPRPGTSGTQSSSAAHVDRAQSTMPSKTKKRHVDTDSDTDGDGNCSRPSKMPLTDADKEHAGDKDTPQESPSRDGESSNSKSQTKATNDDSVPSTSSASKVHGCLHADSDSDSDR